MERDSCFLSSARKPQKSSARTSAIERCFSERLQAALAQIHLQAALAYFWIPDEPRRRTAKTSCPLNLLSATVALKQNADYRDDDGSWTWNRLAQRECSGSDLIPAAATVGQSVS